MKGTSCLVLCNCHSRTVVRADRRYSSRSGVLSCVTMVANTGRIWGVEDLVRIDLVVRLERFLVAIRATGYMAEVS